MNPEKCQIWTRWFAGCMLIIEKNSWTKDKGNLDPPSILVISPSKPWNFLGDGSIYERRAWRHFYQGTVRPYHGTTPGVMFSKHVFHFCIVVNPVNNAFMVDYCHTFPWNICPFLVKGMRMYLIARAWFSRPFLCTLSCTDCLNLNYVH